MAKGFAVGRPGQFDEFRRFCIQRMEQASLRATDRAAASALRTMRAEMKGSGLGNLGNALGYGSDLQKGGRIHRIGAEGYRVSGWVFVRSKSERAVGALEAYTQGAEITPRKSPWMWISTDEIPRKAGRYRMTPALYRSTGQETKIGPLVMIPGRHKGEALLIVRNVTVPRFGRAGGARRLPKRGAVGPGRERKDFIVAFVGIRRTSRSARVNPNQIIALEAARLPEYRRAAMQSDGFER